MNNNVITNTNEALIDENAGFKYKFSIVMPVYNVSEYIDEAVNCVFNQDIGFTENIQLILVDDGSPDDSGEKCDRYKSLYPDNIIVIHKENGGLSSARMAGAKCAEGRYVNYMDPDDALTRNTLSKVYNFFNENDHIVDMVSVPVVFFGDQKGQHHLNNKFKKGTRIINLQKEHQYIQMFSNSSFIKNHLAKKQVFNSKLVVGEDLEQNIRILMDNPYLGVVTGCNYLYRKRSDSLVGVGTQKRGWYTDYVRYLSKNTLDYAFNKFGYIPKFVQNAVLCDLQWRLIQKENPEVLSDDETKEYKSLLAECLSKIDDDVIRLQRFIPFDTKLFLISKKYKDADFISQSCDQIIYGFDSETIHKFSNNQIELNFLKITADKVFISLRQAFVNIGDNQISDMMIKIGNSEPISATRVEFMDNVTSIGEVISKYCICDFEIDRKDLLPLSTITFYTKIGASIIKNRNLKSGTFFPIEQKYKNAYYYEDKLMFKLFKDFLRIYSAKNRDRKKAERKFRKELWKSNKLGERKAVIARILSRLYKFFHRKPIWIISDRLNKAGDNGEALFRHLKNINFKGANYFYTINKCPNYYDIKPLGSVLDHRSLKYKIIHLAADCIISAQADHFVNNPFDYYSQPYKDILTRKKFVFLQHGVIRNDLSNWLNRYNKDIAGFICSASREVDSIVNGSYHYTSDKVWLTGLARFDRLYHDEKKYITIMPTWRKYLMTHINTDTGVWEESAGFKSSEYFKFYNSLINDERLISAAEKHGYTICYMPHPNIITKAHMFDHNEKVKFFTINDEYRDIYAQSDLVLTDYSSAIFDFAYLRKPVVYAEFDKEVFFGGKHVCTTGYFDTETDGFGEVAYDYETTVNLLIDYIENGCELKDKYRERIDNFFAFNDKNNCQRILDKILELK